MLFKSLNWVVNSDFLVIPMADGAVLKTVVDKDVSKAVADAAASKIVAHFVSFSTSEV